MKGKKGRMNEQNGTRAGVSEESWFTVQSALRKLVCTSGASGER